MRHIEATQFARWEVSEDGARVRMTIAGPDGALTGVVLPADTLSTLVMTLPAIVEQSLQRQRADGSLRLVYPLASWTLEQAAASPHLILTLSTSDGFKVSFAAAREELSGIGTLAESAAPEGVPPRRMAH